MRLGLVVNPVAGLGGPAGLKGSDGAAVQRLAVARGAAARSCDRAVAALRALGRAGPGSASADASAAASAGVLTAAGAMGAEAVAAAGLEPVVVYRSGMADDGSLGVDRTDAGAGMGVPATTAADTTAAVRAVVAAGADLVLFAGGDGTARDVLAASPPLALGIPAGVKMYSACFAVGPAAAGRLAGDVLSGRVRGVAEVEVLDVNEDQVRTGRVDPRLHGYLPIPRAAGRTQARKAATATSAAGAVAEAARGAVAEMRPGVTYLLGPGSTTAAIADALGVTGTPLGVDVVRDGAVVLADASEREALAAVTGRPARAVVTVIGGQGFLLGRGNQQVSAAVLRAIGPDPLLVVATQDKLVSLGGRPLLVDTGEPDVDRALSGHTRVVTGPGAVSMYPVKAVEQE